METTVMEKAGAPVEAGRVAALDRWRLANDPDGRLDPAHLAEAASLAPLVEKDGVLAFDDARFGELVGFIAELPW